MNRRSFLTQFLQGAIVAVAAPQIVTHGLKLWVPPPVRFFVPVPQRLDADWFEEPRLNFHQFMERMYAIEKSRERHLDATLQIITDKRGKEYLERWL